MNFARRAKHQALERESLLQAILQEIFPVVERIINDALNSRENILKVQAPFFFFYFFVLTSRSLPQVIHKLLGDDIKIHWLKNNPLLLQRLQEHEEAKQQPLTYEYLADLKDADGQPLFKWISEPGLHVGFDEDLGEVIFAARIT